MVFNAGRNEKIKNTEALLETLGTVADMTSTLTEEYSQKVIRDYMLMEDKYLYNTDDSVFISINRDSTFRVSNDELYFHGNSENDLHRLEEIFEKTPFVVHVSNGLIGDNRTSYFVSARARNLKELEQLIKEYRVCNSKYLENKVVEIVSDEGNIYLTRIDDSE